MIASTQTDRFAAYLRMLKDRSGRGFDRLGKQAGVSGSSLHRYCSGLSVPTDYRVVHSFAKVCGASADELRELHQLWALADTERDSPPPPPQQEQEPEPEPPKARRWLTSRYAVVAAVAAVLLAGGLVWLTRAASSAEGLPNPDNGKVLFSAGCQSTVSMGEHDECVNEVQSLLVKAHTTMSVDSDFGPETLRKVTAFQVLAGLPPKGVVDPPTKEALYAGNVSMATWPQQQVEQKIRAVFTEAPDTAVAIARCASFLDPLYVLPNTNGSRNWGVFQISDLRLHQYGGTPRTAFDPAWNIETAHKLWAVNHDFHDWPSCQAALTSSPTPTP
ncbi:helix-turn-helix domain-containing protein [Kutzneria buriramensis]|uniref:Peptidoglycan hydrolase-like protein with peptidoglycan-binding domain n=1 Tax=Kutzneria buriramensis TaxID=1045776 RepID=A0A3E0HP09_9PSEU|nr:helix-turn-helix domain-containing protein [Kutzneria buriramensis]REH48168.1 peptidoglycan hydrolase-like protein with peptidoglycan-binding domain [Kutzneria buriramensis]